MKAAPVLLLAMALAEANPVWAEEQDVPTLAIAAPEVVEASGSHACTVTTAKGFCLETITHPRGPVQPLRNGPNDGRVGQAIEGSWNERAFPGDAPAGLPRGPLDPLAGFAGSQPLLITESKSREAEAEAEEEQLFALGALIGTFHSSEFPYGAPSSVDDAGFWGNTQLLGDWGGLRKSLAENGIFIDLTATTFYQSVSNSTNPGGDWLETAAFNMTISTEAMGLWPGGFIHAGVDSKFGDSANVRAGSFSPVNYSATFPVQQEGDYVLPTEYYLFQELGSPKLVAILGKATGINFADLNIFASNRKYQFNNTALNNNMMLGAFIPWQSTWYGGLVWQATPSLQSVTVAVDPNGSAENFADDFFKDVTIAQQFTYRWGQTDLPGSLIVGGLWSSKESFDFADPTSFAADGEIRFGDALNSSDGGSMFWLTFDQYFYRVPENRLDPDLTFYTPRGVGVFARFGAGPDSSNLIRRFASLGMGGKGMISGRPYDEFGFGWYYLDFSRGTVESLQNVSRIKSLLTGSEPRDFENEQGVEFYYNFAITPAMRLTFDAQYIFNPFLSSNDGSLVIGSRLQLAF
ncbi:carbohydrate porin [Synechococcus sp. BSF8S]|uniref:carbohydrate porin n=2 Tax=unclassified Synechococcus TaxID=2626047 RepID=UPI001C8AAB78